MPGPRTNDWRPSAGSAMKSERLSRLCQALSTDANYTRSFR